MTFVKTREAVGFLIYSMRDGQESCTQGLRFYLVSRSIYITSWSARDTYINLLSHDDLVYIYELYGAKDDFLVRDRLDDLELVLAEQL